MQLKSIFSLLIICIAFSACKKELEPQDSSPAVTAETTPATVAAPSQNDQATPAAALPQPVTQATAVAPGMNPPHGQPNHRCDISVGAPLNAPPGKATASAQTQPAMTINPAQMKAPANSNAVTTTAAGMNPAHGQPGHRCDIGVGQPLASAPPPAVSAQQAAGAPQTQFTVSEPAKVAPQKAQ